MTIYNFVEQCPHGEIGTKIHKIKAGNLKKAIARLERQIGSVQIYHSSAGIGPMEQRTKEIMAEMEAEDTYPAP